ncbi:MAG TPA: acyl carrier protein [Actinomycetota bacterium]|jgi:acyl carrier protein
MIEDDLTNFILDELGWRGRIEIAADSSLIEGGVLDSIGLFHVVAFVESTYGVEIDDQEVDAEHFDSVAAIARLVAEKRGPVAEATTDAG